MEDNDTKLRAGRVGCKDIQRIEPTLPTEGEWQWCIILRCEETVVVPFAVIDGTHGEVLFDLDDAVVSCGKAVVEDERRVCLLPEYANCVVCVDTSS